MNSRSNAIQKENHLCLKTFPIFIQFLKTTEPDNVKIQKTSLEALKIAFKLPDSQQFYDDMLEYAEQLVYNEKVNIQVNGATILNTICSSSVQNAIKSYNEWKKKTKTISINLFQKRLL